MSISKFLFCIICLVFYVAAEEKLVFNEQNFVKMLRGNKKIVEITQTGDIITMSVPLAGKDASLVVTNIYDKKSTPIALPVKTFQYAAVNNKSEEELVLYDQQTGELWHVDLKKHQNTLLHKRQKGEAGFDLYGDNRSKLEYINDRIFGWGYSYNKNLELEGDCVFEVIRKKDGTTDSKKILDYEFLKQEAKRIDPKVQQLGRLLFNGDYIVFNTTSFEEVKDADKEQPKFRPKNSGKLVGIKLDSKKSFLISSFSSLVDAKIAPKKNFLAFITAENKEGTLHIYDLRTQKSVKKYSGKYAFPDFSFKNDFLGAFKLKVSKNKVLQQVMIVNLQTFSKKQFTLQQLYRNWKFTDSDKSLMFVDRKSIFVRSLGN